MRALRLIGWTSWCLMVGGAAATVAAERAVTVQGVPRAEAAKGPALMVNVDADKPAHPVQIESVRVEADLAATTARTRVTMVFRNPHDRILEGNLYFPLPAGSTVAGYALDIDGALVDAVPVTKQQARYIFEEEQRKGIDPGLVEWVGGNNFQTRVWPIPAKGTRTVRIEYTSELTAATAGSRVRYSLPMTWPAGVTSVEVLLRVAQGQLDAAPAEALANAFPGGLRVEKSNNLLTLFGKTESAAETLSDLIVTLDAPEQTVEVGVDSSRGQVYFTLDRLARDPSEGIKIKQEPMALVVVWDVSLGREPTAIARELQMIEKLLGKLRSLTVAPFAEVAHPAKVFDDPAAGLAYLRGLTYDGGTSLRAAAEALAKADPPRGGRVLLVTDGLANLTTELPDLGFPTTVLSASPKANHAVLSALAARSGGRYLPLPSADDAMAQAVTHALTFDPWMLRSVEADAKLVADVVPAGPTPLDGRLTVAGRLLGDAAVLKLHLGTPYETRQTVEVTIRRADALAADQGGDLIARLWAQKRVASLLVEPDKHQEELTALGQRFGLVTPGTSLLVLETLEQHLEYGIEPARSRTEMHKKWSEQIESRATAAKASRREKIDAVVKEWLEQVRWWEQTPDQIAMLLVKKKLEGLVGGNANFTATAQPLGAAAPRPMALAASAPESAPAPGGAAPAPRSPAPADPTGEVVERRMAFREDVRNSPAAPARPAAPLRDGRQEERMRSQVDAIDSRHPGARGGEEADREASAVGGKFDVKPWNPETPYLKAMQAAGPDQAYAVYLEQRKQFATSPAFYLDCANYFLLAGKKELGIRILTGVLELGLEDSRLIRLVARRLEQEDALDLAIPLFRIVGRLRPEEPQSPRDLANALARKADLLAQASPSEAESLYREAVSLLAEVVTGHWDERFPGIEVIAVMEANRHLAAARRLQGFTGGPFALSQLDPKLEKLLDCDLRVVMAWDTDLTDIDLWVTEPTGEKCFYGNPRSGLGGQMSRDFTRGYGPEDYFLRRANPGKYNIQANFYGSGQQQLTGGTTLQAVLVTDFGRPTEKRQVLTRRLTDAKDVVDLGVYDKAK